MGGDTSGKSALHNPRMTRSRRRQRKCEGSPPREPGRQAWWRLSPGRGSKRAWQLGDCHFMRSLAWARPYALSHPVLSAGVHGCPPQPTTPQPCHPHPTYT